MATLTSADENTWVLQNLPLSEPKGYWIGGFQDAAAQEPNQGWQWITGEAWTYTNWTAGEPNDDGDQDHLQFYPSSGTWDDYWGVNRLRYIIEFEMQVGPRRSFGRFWAVPHDRGAPVFRAGADLCPEPRIFYRRFVSFDGFGSRRHAHTRSFRSRFSGGR